MPFFVNDLISNGMHFEKLQNIRFGILGSGSTYHDCSNERCSSRIDNVSSNDFGDRNTRMDIVDKVRFMQSMACNCTV